MCGKSLNSTCAKGRSLQSFQTLQIKSQLRNPFTKNSLMVYTESPEVQIVLPSLRRKVQPCFRLPTCQVNKKKFVQVQFVSSTLRKCSPVARGKAPYLCFFFSSLFNWNLEFSSRLAFITFVISWIWLLGKIRLTGDAEFTNPPLLLD